jgi:hypothetical protein
LRIKGIGNFPQKKLQMRGALTKPLCQLKLGLRSIASASNVLGQQYEFAQGGRNFKSFSPPASSQSGEDAGEAPAQSYSKFEKPAYQKQSNAPSSQPQVPFPEELQQNFEDSSFVSVASEPFSTEIGQILAEPINPDDVEIKPDGVCYLPEIKYRKTLLRAFGPGGFCMVPKGPHSLNGTVLSREYALLCHGRFVSQARGSTTIATFSNPALASEAVRSNALMRCCKDLGIASELWDSAFINAWKDNYAIKRTVTDPAGRMKVLWSKKE